MNDNPNPESKSSEVLQGRPQYPLVYTAYLLIRLRRVPQTPIPVVIGAGIYSSPPCSITCSIDEFYAEIVRENGPDYATAKERIMELVESHPAFRWVTFFKEPSGPIEAMYQKCFNHYNCDMLNK